MSKRIPGLYKRGTQGIWHIDKCVRGYGRLHESTGTSELEEAERYLIRRLEEMRKVSTIVFFSTSGATMEKQRRLRSLVPMSRGS